MSTDVSVNSYLPPTYSSEPNRPISVLSAHYCSSETIDHAASIFPSIRVPLLRISRLFRLVRAGGISGIDRPQGIVRKLSPNLSIGKRGSLHMFMHSMCSFRIDWMPDTHGALIKTDHNKTDFD